MFIVIKDFNSECVTSASWYCCPEEQLSKLEKGADRKLTKFNNCKDKALYWRNNPIHQHLLELLAGRQLCIKDPGVLVDTKSAMGHCNKECKKQSRASFQEASPADLGRW